MEKITKRKLNEYNQILSERDKDMLRSVKMCRFLKTDHAARLHFWDTPNSKAASLAAIRTLTKLQDLGFVKPLQRRIGGIRAGSASYVWTLKTAGVELLRLIENPHNAEDKPSKRYRKRNYEPTYIFLKHTLAIAELYTRLKTTGNLEKVEFEPSCWRGYTTRLGVNVTLKPDLYAVTATDDFKDYWFFELDLDTAPPFRIARKCETYGRYCLTDNEQQRIGVFPRVVWIVPDEKRRDTIWRYICKDLNEYKDLFVVITFDGLDSLISSGAAPVMDTIKQGT